MSFEYFSGGEQHLYPRSDDYAVSAYIHIPFCRRRCFYCDFPISVLGNKTDTDNSTMIDDYTQALCREISNTPPQGYPLETIFFGGGTPSLLPVKYLAQILSCLQENFGIVSGAEISMEMDPGTFNSQQLQGYLALGVSRVSLGVQAFQDDLLSICGRSHTRKDVFAAIDLIRNVGVNNLSLDLISGLPNQSLQDWEESLETAVKIAPNHLSCYDLVLEPVTAFGKKYEPGDTPLPTDEITAQMYRTAQAILTQAGYNHYEVSNYAQPNFACRHNRVYWENKSYYAFGMGATSYVNNQRFTRPRTRQSYYTWVQEFCNSAGVIDCAQTSTSDRLLETLMLGLRLSDGVDLSVLRQQYGDEIIKAIWDCLQPHCQMGWVQGLDSSGNIVELKGKNLHLWNIERIRLSDPEGFLFSNTVLSSLFAFLNAQNINFS